jgi:hypothetical protein
LSSSCHVSDVVPAQLFLIAPIKQSFDPGRYVLLVL